MSFLCTTLPTVPRLGQPLVAIKNLISKLLHYPSICIEYRSTSNANTFDNGAFTTNVGIWLTPTPIPKRMHKNLLLSTRDSNLYYIETTVFQSKDKSHIYKLKNGQFNYETCWQRMMVGAFIIFDWMVVMMNSTPMIPCWGVS